MTCCSKYPEKAHKKCSCWFALIFLCSAACAALMFAAASQFWIKESYVLQIGQDSVDFEAEWAISRVCYEFRNDTLLMTQNRSYQNFCTNWPSFNAPPHWGFAIGNFLSITVGIMFVMCIVTTLCAVRWQKIFSMPVSVSVMALIMLLLIILVFPVGWGADYQFNAILETQVGNMTSSRLITVPNLNVCNSSGSYKIGDCSLSIGFLLAIVAGALAIANLCFVCKAKKTTDKINDTEYDKLGYV